MTIARSQLIDVNTTPYYHCVSRCVRRAFLCGFDAYSKTDYEHRRTWVEDRILHLASVFAIDIAAYTIMSNHYHLVLHIDQKTASEWSDDEVLQRWCLVFKGPVLVQRYRAGQPLCEPELKIVLTLVQQYRKRLMCISWFMRLLNEFIARRANEEDNCTGRFWESRFKCQALLDEAAILTCMAYVDLNPIRAKMATTPEQSHYTSVQQRIQALNSTAAHVPLLPFIGNEKNNMPKGLVFHLMDYLELIDWTGRAVRHNKRGVIPTRLAPILERLNLTQQDWLSNSQYFEHRFKRMAGHWDSIKNIAELHKQRWFQGKPPRQAKRI